MGILKLLTLAGALLTLYSCGFRGTEMKGAVEEVVNFHAPPDQWKYVPIANAEVLVLWRGQRANNPFYGSSVCLRAIYTKSGPDGRFTVPGWWRAPRSELIVDVMPVSYAFVPGFQEVGPQTQTNPIWMPGPGLHVMRRSEPGELPRLRENAFMNAQSCLEGDGVNANKAAAAVSRPASTAPANPPLTAGSCPLICLELEYGGGCIGGCITPATSTSLATVDGNQVEVGVWIQGSGPGGEAGNDLQFETVVRQPTASGLIECSFTIDGKISGERTELCAEPLGAVQVTVEKQ